MSVFAGPNNDTRLTIDKLNVNGLVTSNLELYYDLNRSLSYIGTGAVIRDISGNGRDCTLYNAGGSTYSTNAPGAPTYIKVRTGEFQFDGNDFGKFPTISAGSAITVSAWCKTTDTSRENGIISHCNGGPVNLGYSIASNKMKYWYYDTTWRTVVSTASVNDGNWKNLVWAKSGTSMLLYINNVLDSTHTLNSSVSGSLVSFGCMWGACNSDSYGPGSDGYGQCFIGSIGMVAVHSKQLTATEIQQNFNALRKRYNI
jgi:hypothetical protein